MKEWSCCWCRCCPAVAVGLDSVSRGGDKRDGSGRRPWASAFVSRPRLAGAVAGSGLEPWAAIRRNGGGERDGV